MIVTLLTYGLPAFKLSLAPTLTAERAAPKLGLVARPTAGRRHCVPVPLMGGVRISVATVLGVLAASRPTTALPRTWRRRARLGYHGCSLAGPSLPGRRR